MTDSRANILLVLVTVLVAACSSKPDAPEVSISEIRAPKLLEAIPRPGFILTRSDGTPFNFRNETRGTLTFLFVGYTICPDVCPLHMQNIAAVLDSLPEEAASRVRFVFVTTDPERDTPERLTSWLKGFDSTFIGLTGDARALEVAQRSVGAPVAGKEAADSSGGYGVMHAAQLFAFTPDDSCHVVYPWGVKQEDFISDIPRLLALYPAKEPD
jgi:protein SCO1/2